MAGVSRVPKIPLKSKPQQKVDDSTDSTKQHLDRLKKQDEIIELCNGLKLGESKDIAHIEGIPILCRLLKQLTVLSDLKLDSDITQSPEDFSCLLKLLKKHEYGYCNISTCCEIAKRLLKISGLPNSTRHQAELLKALSDLLVTKGNYDEAVVAAKQLVNVAYELGDKKLEAEACFIMIKPYVLKGSLKEAKCAVEACVQCSEASGDEMTIGYSKLAVSIIHESEQNHKKALAEGEKFLEIAKRLDNKVAICEATLHLGGVYYALFKIQEALTFLSEGLKMATELEHHKKALHARMNQNTMCSVMGQYKKSYKLGKEMLKKLSTYEDKKNVFGVLCNQSVCALMLDQNSQPSAYTKESLGLAQQALAVAKEMEATELLALAYGNIGLAQEKLQNYEGAIKSYEECLEYGEKIKEKRIINNSYCNLGRAYEGRGDRQRAKENYLEAYNMPQPPSSHWCDTEDFRFSPDYHLGRIAVEEKDYSTAKKYFQEVVDRCEKLRKTVHDSSLKICFNDTQKKPFQYLQHVLLKTGKEIETLLVGEMGRGRDFYDKVIKEDKSKQFNTPEALIELAKSNNQAVLFLSKLDVVREMLMWFIAPDGKVSSFVCPLEKWEDLLKELRTVFFQTQIASLRTEEAQSSPQMAIEFRGVDKPLSDDEFGDESDDESGDEYHECGMEDGIKSNRSETEPGTRGPPSATTAPTSATTALPSKFINDFSDLIDKFSEIIVRPIESHLESLVSKSDSKPELLIIPQGQTFNIPYAALSLKNKEPLCSIVSLREAFSFHSYFYSTMLQEEANTQPLQMKDVLIVGNPTNDLEFAQQEAKMIAETLGITPLLNNSATRSEVLHRLPRAPIIHFACHGSTDGKWLKLAPEEGNNNGENPLTVEDISNLSLKASVVVLSACHTARGKISSEGVLGLARAFLMAGSKSVVTALWTVNDHATKEFMLKFYSHLSTQPVVDALATTMCEMKKEKFDVIHWGSFKVLGANVKVFDQLSADV